MPSCVEWLDAGLERGWGRGSVGVSRGSVGAVVGCPCEGWLLSVLPFLAPSLAAFPKKRVAAGFS